MLKANLGFLGNGVKLVLFIICTYKYLDYQKKIAALLFVYLN
jgi:hypothetical protein